MRRRQFIATTSALTLAATLASASDASSRFRTRGVVLYPWDLSLRDWPERAAAAKLTTIGLHAARRLDVLIEFVQSQAGHAFASRCQDLGIEIEFELHAMGDLLSRELYYRDTSLFRVDKSGNRTLDFNLCPSSKRAIEIVAEKAVEVARILKPTTNRYFFWPDDGREWCECRECKGLTASDQATLVENGIADAIRKQVDPTAMVCHIAYHHTLEPPKQVKPHEGLFVEFAPISRNYEHSIAMRDFRLPPGGPGPDSHGGYLDLLDANLECFGTQSAQVLEYWLDVSMFSRWTRPSKKLPWNPNVFQMDIAAYAARGIGHITSFATWIDDRYVRDVGEPPLEEYGHALSKEGS